MQPNKTPKWRQKNNKIATVVLWQWDSFMWRRTWKKWWHARMTTVMTWSNIVHNNETLSDVGNDFGSAHGAEQPSHTTDPAGVEWGQSLLSHQHRDLLQRCRKGQDKQCVSLSDQYQTLLIWPLSTHKNDRPYYRRESTLVSLNICLFLSVCLFLPHFAVTGSFISLRLLC